MRLIISGGGTGGHIYPAVTIARAIEKAEPDTKILFVGTRQGLEADIVPKEGFDFATVEVHGFQRRLSMQNLLNIFTTMASVLKAWRIVKEFRPDIVIGTGGYVCGPVLLAASLRGVPTIIQEQNVIPGITNRILSHFVNRIAAGYEGAVKRFKTPDKVIVTGNPIRDDVITAEKQEGLIRLGLDADKLTILISGGSRGARSLNNAMLQLYSKYAGRNDVQFLHVTGKNEYDSSIAKLQAAGIDLASADNIHIRPYLYNMPDALAVADLAIFRAGAIGLAELTARGVAAILVPYPYAAENHQEYNAREMEKAGAAVVIKDRDLNGPYLKDTLDALFADHQRIRDMAAASSKLGKPAAAKHIAQMAVKLAAMREELL